VFVHHALLERAVQRAERIEELVAELLPALCRRLPESRRDDPEQVLRLLLVLPLLDLLAALMFVDRFQREVDVALVLVDLQDFADDLLALAHVVPDVLDPAAADLGDVDEAFLVLVFVERDERAEVLDVGHGTDDEFAFVGPVVPAPGGLRLRHYSRTPRISPRIAAFPPVGFATVAPQTWHKTVLAARSKTTCSLPQSSHLTRRHRLDLQLAMRVAERTVTANTLGHLHGEATEHRYRGELVFMGSWVRTRRISASQMIADSSPQNSKPPRGLFPSARNLDA